ncbi:MAG: hypothetical protein QM564_05125 [Bergeyella sp.]
MKNRFLISIIFSVMAIGCDKKDSLSKISTPNKTEQKPKSKYLEREKFVTKYKFEDFPVNKIEEKNPKLKINTNVSSYTKMYRTMIKQSFEKNETNFAGKYIIDYWGCGSPCATGIAINGKNGKLIEIPSASAGYDSPYKFRKDSRLLIINPPDSLGYYISGGVYDPELYYLDTLKSKFIKLED